MATLDPTPMAGFEVLKLLLMPNEASRRSGSVHQVIDKGDLESNRSIKDGGMQATPAPAVAPSPRANEAAVETSGLEKETVGPLQRRQPNMP